MGFINSADIRRKGSNYVTVGPGGAYATVQAALDAASALSPTAANRVQVRLMPGVYTITAAVVAMPYVDVVGEGGELCKIVRTSSGSGSVQALSAADNSVWSGVGLVNAHLTGDQRAVYIPTGTNNFELRDCYIEAQNFGILGEGTITDCAVIGCRFNTPQPLWVTGDRWRIRDNVCVCTGADVGSCIGFLDSGGMGSLNTIENNLYIASIAGDQSIYVWRTPRAASLIRNNVCMVTYTKAVPLAGRNVQCIIPSIYGDSGAYDAFPNVFEGNTIILSFEHPHANDKVYALGWTDNDIPIDVFSQIVLRNNFIRVLGGTNYRRFSIIDFMLSGGSIILERGGLAGTEAWGDLLLPAVIDIIGLETGSGAGLTGPLIDAALGGGTGNRGVLANWFRGKYVNTSDSNKIYTVYTDGTTWYANQDTAVGEA